MEPDLTWTTLQGVGGPRWNTCCIDHRPQTVGNYDVTCIKALELSEIRLIFITQSLYINCFTS